MILNPILGLILVHLVVSSAVAGSAASSSQPYLGRKSVDIITVDNLKFKDLNHDGALTPYEDWRLLAKTRAKDLIRHMSLKEKAGLMMFATAPAMDNRYGIGENYDIVTIKELIQHNKIRTFLTRLDNTPFQLAEQHNRLQELAESSRLGIPLTIAINPQLYDLRQLTSEKLYTIFSQWITPLALAAMGDESRIQYYAEQLRQKYRAIGVTMIFAPQADLATEPRWSLIKDTFGEDPELVKRMVYSFVVGLQGGDNGINNQSVSSIIGHWVGAGVAEQGFDSHHVYGKYVLFGNDKKEEVLKQHVDTFTSAFDAQVAGVMPSYAILKDAEYQGVKIDQVGVTYNRFLLQGLLRNIYHYQGLIISDWFVTDDCVGFCLVGYAIKQPVKIGGMPWGVELLSQKELYVRAILAGVDQLGGVSDTEALIQSVLQGDISELRLNESVERILIQKFSLGLFENPYVNATEVEHIWKNNILQQEINQMQRDSLVLLENKQEKLLPLKKGTKIFLFNMEETEAHQQGMNVVNNINDAQVVIMRLRTPFELLHPSFFFGHYFHEGDLSFSEQDPALLLLSKIQKDTPIIILVTLDRPAVLTPFIDRADVLIADFGVSESVMMTALIDGKPFVGQLPIALPSSMFSVLKQDPALPNDLDDPLYPVGFGL